MTLRASILRRETRPSILYRDDYPLVDNANWLKWITVEKTGDGGMKFSTEGIPFEKYKFRPQMFAANEQTTTAT
jgi:succinate dehydrogenase/fumarate reductase flavoprotein subunit